MRKLKSGTGVLLVGLWLVIGMVPVANADVSPGEVIDKTNWEKAQGLVPNPVLDWLKRGDLTMEVVELNHDPQDYVVPFVQKTMETNKGRHDVDENGLMVDIKTGELPAFVEGIPFPEVDPKDPKAGEKLMYNKFYYNHSQGSQIWPFSARWIGLKSGLEREVMCDYRQFPLDGFPGAKEAVNKEQMEKMSMIIVVAPFDVRGTNILLWRYRDERQDSTFGYIPAIRRVRRMSPANRSDSFLGSDGCVDDAWTFDGKVSSMNWKLIGKRDGLVPFVAPDPQSLSGGDECQWMTTATFKDPVYGHEKEGWQGAPWWPTTFVWVKRPMYVIEMSAKDPYYNYGPQEIWIDAEIQMISVWKVIHDRAGKYWKTTMNAWASYAGPSEDMRTIQTVTLLMVDDRTRHGTVFPLNNSRQPAGLLCAMDQDDFSLGGFKRFCK